MGISVVVIDQERAFTDILAACLGTEEDVDVVAAVHAAAPAWFLIPARRADAWLLDADLAGDAANRLCEELSAREDAPRVVMLSFSSQPARIAAAIRAGASAWVRKDESLEYLLRVVRGVVRGETWLPPAETGTVLRLLMRERDRSQESDRLLAALTPREQQVLACVADGAGPREVAMRLHLSANTVRTHLKNLMAKLGVHSALEAVALSRPWLDQLSWTAAPAPDAGCWGGAMRAARGGPGRGAI
ncbi:MAG TPA: response regulator transcription factor [Streptosporangiaceae bacterium]|nr:response regulator transcription factor [Streptosporangiaceae bacterium]